MSSSSSYVQLSPDTVRRTIETGDPILLVDVRTPEEYADRHIPGALLMPLNEFPARCAALSPNDEIVCLCEHGIRSEMAAQYLVSLGYTHVANMTGGMAAYRGKTEGVKA